ncbi:MAG TPA: glycerol-3-phosphate acyltransferase [Candidatus Gallimonas gallistercoris]|uniref:Glycerol-3-phosphate acyltransferase n=1 Tax=Candidatus Gallimonas gallistercoris TaxID=2838602 RepID=A0A9D2H2V1_9FIRM|nr:glycerol-3-phosphate acyltransferase [Candidatus Gallimonas gallistercoris]
MQELTFFQNWYWFVLMALVCYFVGCVNFAMIIARTKHKDAHKIGSGNPGTMNMSREFGLKVGLVNFLLDVAKGGVPALVSYFIFRGYVFAGTDVVVSDFTRYFCGVFVIIGHIWPVTMRFRGGKGIASTLGLFWFTLGCERGWFAAVAFLWLVCVLLFIAVTEWGSMGSLLGVTGFSLWQGVIFFLRYEAELQNTWVILIFMLLLLLNFLTWFAHRKNLVRLFAGEEHRTSVKKLSKGKRGMQNM